MSITTTGGTTTGSFFLLESYNDNLIHFQMDFHNYILEIKVPGLYPSCKLPEYPRFDILVLRRYWLDFDIFLMF